MRALYVPFFMLFTILLFLKPTHCQSAQLPRVIVIIVIDQLSTHYIPKLRPYLTGGIGMLARDGVQYVNAFYDHAIAATAPDHYVLSTGTYGSIHGIVNNKWYDSAGKLVACDDDTDRNAAVFNPHGGLYPYGKSARLSQADTLSDQLILHSYPHASNTVWSLSLKSRAAIAMAGRLGKALWLDEKTGLFTSSKAYFKALPSWVKEYNAHIGQPRVLKWNPLYPLASKAYNFKYTDNHEFASKTSSLLGKSFSPEKEGFEMYQAMPLTNKDLLNLALTAFKKQYSPKKNDRFVLWLGLSSLDKIGHIYGPDSKEAIDMLYHIDVQLKMFIEKLYTIVPRDELLFVLTADHGVQPIPELLKKEGMDLSRRYYAPDLIGAMNELISKKYAIHDFVVAFKEPQFYVDHKKLAQLTEKTKKKIYRDLKNYLLSLPGIRRAWTFEELQKTVFAEYDLDKYLSRQLYKGRSGQIIYSVNPYTHLDTHLKGTSHISQYAYDTQVPLIFYQKGRFEKNRIVQNVYMPQVSVTLATLLNVPRPSAAAASVLPGLQL